MSQCLHLPYPVPLLKSQLPVFFSHNHPEYQPEGCHSKCCTSSLNWANKRPRLKRNSIFFRFYHAQFLFRSFEVCTDVSIRACQTVYFWETIINKALKPLLHLLYLSSSSTNWRISRIAAGPIADTMKHDRWLSRIIVRFIILLFLHFLQAGLSLCLLCLCSCAPRRGREIYG